MTKDALNGWSVDGKISATAQATNEGDVPVLNASGKLPGGMIDNTAVQFTIPASAWSGTGPYTASVTSSAVGEITTPIIGPDDPDGSVREALADAQITALSISAGVISFVADGDKPTIPLNCIATGIKGTSTGHVISTFGAGGGGVDFYLNVNVTASAGTPVLSGISVVATPTTGTPLTGTTDADGKLTLGVKQGMTYTVTLSKTNFTINPSSKTLTIQDTSTSYDATCYEAPKLTVNCSGADKAGRTVTCTSDGETLITAVTDSSGVADIILGIAEWSVSVDYPTGQGVSPASATVNATAGGVYTKNFTILAKPVATLTVVDKAIAGNEIGRTITATPTSGTAVTGTTNSSGVAALTLLAGVAYVISCDTPSGYVAPDNYPLTPVAGQTYAHEFDLYEEAQITVSVSPAAIKQGRTITATATGISPVTGTTGADGSCTLSVPEGTWTITCDTPAGYFAPASQTQVAAAGQTYMKTFSLDSKPVLTVTVGPTAAASGLLVRVVGDTTVTAYTNSSGVATLELVEDDYLISVVAPTGYVTPASQSLTAVKNNTYSKTFALQTKPTVAVTVTDSSSSGFQSGRTITATNGTDAVTGTTNISGVANLTLNDVGAYTIHTDLPTGATCDPVTITAEAGGSYTASLVLNFGFLFSMNLNATTMQSDPTGCLAYADDAAGMANAVNASTALARITTIGSWAMDNNKMLKDCFYATLLPNAAALAQAGDSPISKILDPDNLALDEDGNASDITTNNTMFIVPRRYLKGVSGKLSVSSKSTEGDLLGHIFGDSEFDKCAISVFPGYVSGSKLMSISGVTPTRSQTRATFRTQAQANGTNFHLMNWYEWQMLRLMTFFVFKSFDGQRKCGQGVSTGSNYGPTTGLCNAMGPFAGNISGTTDQVKCFIEQPWGGSYLFLDDTYETGGALYVGRNANPTDNISNKINIGATNPSLTGGYPNAILQTSADRWGVGTNVSGSDSTGLCDYQYVSTSADRLALVGGDADYDAYCGPSCLVSYSLSCSNSNCGARLAFVYND